jgi:translation initiation factor 5B
VAVKEEKDVEEVKKLVQREVEEVEFTRDVDGVVVKADTLGSLEAMIKILSEEGVEIKKAEVGLVNKEDVVESQNSSELRKAILAFNVKVPEEIKVLAKDLGVTIFENNIIYRLIESYREWCRVKKEEMRRARIERLVWPAKIKLLPGYVFRASKPAIVGIEVLAGCIKSGVRLVRKDGKEVGTIKEIQKEGKSLPEARTGDKVAISMEEPTVGRQVEEGDILYAYLPESSINAWLSEFKDQLTEEELKIIEEFKQTQA